MKLNSRGMSLVGVLTAAAILGILAAVFVTVYGNLNGLMVRSTADTDAHNLMRFIQQIVGQRAICDYALRSTPRPPGLSNRVTWNFKANQTCNGRAGSPTVINGKATWTTCADIDNIQINRNGAATATPGRITMVAAQNMYLSSGPEMQIEAIYIRQPDPALGESAPSVATVNDYWDTVNGKPCQSNATKASGVTPCAAQTFDTTTAKLVVRFKKISSSAWFGSPVYPEYTADLVVAVDQNAGQNLIQFCAEAQNVQAVNGQCVPTCANPADTYSLTTGSCQPNNSAVQQGLWLTNGTPCPGGAPPAPCYQFYYIGGFQTDGDPICRCEIACDDPNIISPSPSATGTPKLKTPSVTGTGASRKRGLGGSGAGALGAGGN